MCSFCMVLIVVCKLIMQMDTTLTDVEVSSVVTPTSAVSTPAMDEVGSFICCLNRASSPFVAKC